MAYPTDEEWERSERVHHALLSRGSGGRIGALLVDRASPEQINAACALLDENPQATADEIHAIINPGGVG